MFHKDHHAMLVVIPSSLATYYVVLWKS